MIKKESFTDYAAHPAINASFLKKLRKSPLTALGIDQDETAALTFGSAYHCYILEPELFDSEYLIYDPDKRPEPEKTFAAKANKEWKAEQYETAAAQGKTILDSADLMKIKLMAERLKLNNINADVLIKNSEHELSVYQSVEMDGNKYDVKCRVDGLNVDLETGVMYDLKTTKDAHPDGFGRECGKYGYHISAAFYKRLLELEYNKPFEFFIIAQETEAPFNSGLYRVSTAMINKGNYEVDNLMKLANHVNRTGELSSYEIFTNDPYGILPLDIPNYFVPDYDLNI